MSTPKLENQSDKGRVNANSTNQFGWQFVGLSIFMLGLCVGWSILTNWLNIVLEKQPVPWPASVQVDKRTFQNTSFPNEIGRYKLIEEDGVLFKKKDGKPDGIVEFKEDELETLGIGTSLDGIRFSNRSCNWYLSRYYEDTNPKSEVRLWRLDLTYYTGNADKVPHVPENCGEKSGNTLDFVEILEFDKILDIPAWSKFKVKHVGLQSNLESGRKTSIFYFFTVNGSPEIDRIKVRKELAWPSNKYVFFAKISLTPVHNRRSLRLDKKVMQKEAIDFFKSTLPVIMKQFPQKQSIEQLEQTKS